MPHDTQSEEDNAFRQYLKNVIGEARLLLDTEFRELHAAGNLEHSIRARLLWVEAARDFQREMLGGTSAPDS